MGKSEYNQAGGVNYLCLTKSPDWLPGKRGGYQSEAYIYGTEYDRGNSPIMSSSRQDQDAVCVVCERPKKTQMMMIPGTKWCPVGWTREYYGVLMSEKYNMKPADFVCVDTSFDYRYGGSDDKGGAYLVVVEARCGSLPCPPYYDGYEVSCVVCTK